MLSGETEMSWGKGKTETGSGGACKARQFTAETMSAPQDPLVNYKGFSVDQNRLLVSNLTYAKCLKSLDVISQMTPVTGATRSRVRQIFKSTCVNCMISKGFLSELLRRVDQLAKGRDFLCTCGLTNEFEVHSIHRCMVGGSVDFRLWISV
ncbi:hypothetical protein IWQ48_005860 [Labrenzia sp. EL_13]|nr:hypothetical protein [Labrenzia sp. EL_13]